MDYAEVMKKNQISLLFGAGSSAPFGVPTMISMIHKFEEFTEIKKLDKLFTERDNNNLWGYQSHVIEKQSKFSYLKEWFSIWSYLKKMQQYNLDLEWFLSMLDKGTDLFSTETMEAYKEEVIIISAYAGDYSNRISFKEQSRQFETYIRRRVTDLRNSLMEFVRIKCAVKASSESLLKTYNTLFEAISNYSIKIFTTNYDTLIERYFTEIGLKFELGVDSEGCYDPFRYEKSETDIDIIKLHGSIDLFKTSKGIQYCPVIDGSMLSNGENAGTCMIYPNLMKEIDKPPYSVLLNQFENCIHSSKCCIVVGHSLRDQHILNMVRHTNLK